MQLSMQNYCCELLLLYNENFEQLTNLIKFEQIIIMLSSVQWENISSEKYNYLNIWKI